MVPRKFFFLDAFPMTPTAKPTAALLRSGSRDDAAID